MANSNYLKQLKLVNMQGKKYCIVVTYKKNWREPLFAFAQPLRMASLNKYTESFLNLPRSHEIEPWRVLDFYIEAL